jgi:hypothetical protein
MYLFQSIHFYGSKNTTADNFTNLSPIQKGSVTLGNGERLAQCERATRYHFLTSRQWAIYEPRGAERVLQYRRRSWASPVALGIHDRAGRKVFIPAVLVEVKGRISALSPGFDEHCCAVAWHHLMLRGTIYLDRQATAE